MSAATSGPAGAGKNADRPSSVPPSIPVSRRTAPQRTVPLLNIANVLTLSRLLLVPLFVVALFTENGVSVPWRLIATGLFALASLTDQLDGFLARRYGLVTDFGKIADPIADKALTGAALVGLSLLGELAWWVTVTIAVREILVTFLRFWVIRFGVIPASQGGKAKTLTQMAAIVAYLLPLPDSPDTAFLANASPTDLVRWILMGIAVALTVVTGLDYLFRVLRLRRRGKSVLNGTDPRSTDPRPR